MRPQLVEFNLLQRTSCFVRSHDGSILILQFRARILYGRHRHIWVLAQCGEAFTEAETATRASQFNREVISVSLLSRTERDKIKFVHCLESAKIYILLSLCTESSSLLRVHIRSLQPIINYPDQSPGKRTESYIRNHLQLSPMLSLVERILFSLLFKTGRYNWSPAF